MHGDPGRRRCLNAARSTSRAVRVLADLRDGIALWGRLVAVSIRSQMQYRASFVMLVIGTFAVTFLEFAGVWVLFDRFGRLREWSLAEVAVFYGIVNTSYALTESTSRGFEYVHRLIRSGDFDRVLLRPRSTELQLAGQELQLRRLGRFSQGLFVLAWAWGHLGLGCDPARLALTGLAVCGGACLFYGLMVLNGTLSFWTTETLEIMNSLTDGGNAAAQYPLSIYEPAFRRFFTFVVPLACVAYYPALAVVGRADPGGAPVIVSWLAPAAGYAFLALSLAVWRVGVRHYRSTGS